MSNPPRLTALAATILASPHPSPTTTQNPSTLITLSSTAPVIIGLAPTPSTSGPAILVTPSPSPSPTNPHTHAQFPWLWLIVAVVAIYISAAGIFAGWWVLRRRNWRSGRRGEVVRKEVVLEDREETGKGMVQEGSSGSLQGQSGGGERVRVQENGTSEEGRELGRVESWISTATTVVGSIGRAY